jgi:hypothetical protein
MVGWVRTAGSGLTAKFAVGGGVGHAVVVGVCVVGEVQSVFAALRSSIWIRYWVPHSRPRIVTESWVTSVMVAGG